MADLLALCKVLHVNVHHFLVNNEVDNKKASDLLMHIIPGLI